jgi:hypothetical protein
LSKIDLLGPEEDLPQFNADEKVLAVSAVSGKNLQDVIDGFYELIQKAKTSEEE